MPSRSRSGKRKKNKRTKSESEGNFSIWDSESSVKGGDRSTTSVSTTSASNTTSLTSGSYIRSISDYDISGAEGDYFDEDEECPDELACKEFRTGRQPKMMRTSGFGLDLLFIGIKLIFILITAILGGAFAIMINYWTYDKLEVGRRLAIPYTEIYFPAEALMKNPPQYCIYQNVVLNSNKKFEDSFCLDDNQAQATDVIPLKNRMPVLASECLTYFAPQQLFSYSKTTKQLSKPKRAIIRDGQRMCLEGTRNGDVILNDCHPHKDAQIWITMSKEWYIFSPHFNLCLQLVEAKDGPATKIAKLLSCDSKENNKTIIWKCIKPLAPEKPLPPEKPLSLYNSSK